MSIWVGRENKSNLLKYFYIFSKGEFYLVILCDSNSVNCSQVLNVNKDGLVRTLMNQYIFIENKNKHLPLVCIDYFCRLTLTWLCHFIRVNNLVYDLIDHLQVYFLWGDRLFPSSWFFPHWDKVTLICLFESIFSPLWMGLLWFWLLMDAVALLNK